MKPWPFFRESSPLRRGLSAGSHTPRCPWFTHSLVPPPASVIAGSVSGRRAIDKTAKCPESLCPILALPPSGRRTPPPRKTLLLRPRSYGLMRQSRLALLYFGFASLEKSLQVATSPCCHRDLPDVISASPSRDAWPLPRRLAGCMYLLLPLQHRPSPKELWVGVP